MGFGATISPQAQLTTGTRIQRVNESFDNPIPGMGAVTATDNTCSSNGTFGVGEKVTLSIPLVNPLTNAVTDVSAQVTGGGSAILRHNSTGRDRDAEYCLSSADQRGLRKQNRRKRGCYK